MEQLLSVSLELLKGFGETLKLFAMTLVFAIPLGLVVCTGTRTKYKPLRFLTRGFVWVIRGTPLMLQLLVIFYGPGLLFGLKSMPRFTAAVLAFSINYACYFSEIYRGGIESIPQGQYEAGYVLGLTRGQIFSKIVLPQMIKRVIPPMGNEIITLVKDTALARTISVYEVLWSGQMFIKKGLLWPLFYTAVYYLLFNGLLTVLFSKIEKKLNYYKG